MDNALIQRPQPDDPLMLAKITFQQSKCNGVSLVRRLQPLLPLCYDSPLFTRVP